jgi:hypothetical protein
MTINDIEQQITQARAAIAKSQATNAALTHQRATALEAGNDGEVDRIEISMKINDTAITRGRDRIAILEQRLGEAKQQERESALDALTADSDKARVEGESLIREYAKHAAAIAPIMLKLKSIDGQITESNRQLQSAGRDPVNTPNAIRCRPFSSGTRTVRRTVGVGEPDHPMHKLHTFDRNGNCRHRETGEPIEQFGEFDIIEKTHDRGVYADPLYDAVQLPSVEPGSANFWPNPNAAVEIIDQPASLIGRVRNLIGSKAA